MVAVRSAALFADHVLSGDRQQAFPAHPLAQHGDELVVHRVDRVVLAVGEGLRDFGSQLLGGAVVQVLEQAAARAAHRAAAVGKEVGAAVAQGEDLAAAVQRRYLLFGPALHVRVEGAAQALVARDDQDQGLARTGLAAVVAARRRQQRVLHLARRHGGEMLRHLAQFQGVRARREDLVLRATQLRRGDHLHRLGDLLRVLHRPDAPAKIDQARHRSELPQETVSAGPSFLPQPRRGSRPQRAGRPGRSPP